MKMFKEVKLYRIDRYGKNLLCKVISHKYFLAHPIDTMGNWMIVSGTNFEMPLPQSNTIGAGETEHCVEMTTKKAVKGKKNMLFFQTVPGLIRKHLATSYTDPYGGQKGNRQEPHFLTSEDRLRCGLCCVQKSYIVPNTIEGKKGYL